MRTLLFSSDKYSSSKINIGLLLVRLFFGLTMAFAHGLGKMPPSEQFIGYMVALSLPFPVLMAWAAALSEFIGSLFISLGLMTRLSSLFLSITMFVAAFVAHGDDPFAKKEKALCYLVVFIFLFITGPGSISIDDKVSA